MWRGFVEAAFGVGGHVTLKMADERGDVLEAIGEAGNLEHDHAEAEEQVFAEFAVGDRSAKILMRRRDDAHIDLAHLAAADADDRPVFEHAEQLDLHVETHVADFVETVGAAVACLEIADAAGGGAGARAFFMDDELGLDRKSTCLNSSP